MLRWRELNLRVKSKCKFHIKVHVSQIKWWVFGLFIKYRRACLNVCKKQFIFVKPCLILVNVTSLK